MFSSPTCEPCRQIAPMIQGLKEDFPDIQWVHVNIRNDPQGLTQKFGVTVVPTIVVQTPSGVEKYSGTSPMGYYRILKNATQQLIPQ
jgi:thiol-disulfide isomerase/thioredoxin